MSRSHLLSSFIAVSLRFFRLEYRGARLPPLKAGNRWLRLKLDDGSYIAFPLSIVSLGYNTPHNSRDFGAQSSRLPRESFPNSLCAERIPQNMRLLQPAF